jgi:hypothetical protein
MSWWLQIRQIYFANFDAAGVGVRAIAPLFVSLTRIFLKLFDIKVTLR